MNPTANADLTAWVDDARTRILDQIADLDDDQLMGPQLDIVNPLRWEIGHVAWFFEKWVIREAAGGQPLLENSDALYDSIAIAHDTRWGLPLPDRHGTVDYIERVLERTRELVGNNPPPEVVYHTVYSVYHADMHTEAFTYSRQTNGWPFPPTAYRRVVPTPEPVSGDAEIAGGEFLLGANPNTTFCFDNEKWAHPVKLEPFAIARAAVTEGEYAAFCDAGGYDERSYWTDEGWMWRTEADVKGPLYWEKKRNKWRKRHFDTWVDLQEDHPVIHVNWHEANAWCAWADRRLPTEAEWEAAAALSHPEDAASSKRIYPWGDIVASDAAHTDWDGGGTAPVGAYADGESAAGCRQMLGNVWEWTSDTFRPYPGFEADPYKEYSEPWFDTRKVLRGGCWATRSRMLWNTWRNYFTPDRRDVFAGFRTCPR